MKTSIRKGKSNVEIIMTMVLLILFGGSIFTLIYAGGTTQRRIIDEKNVKVNARVASSYINVKLKKYDEEGAVSVQVNPLTNENALVFRDEPDPNYTNEELFTWIFFEDGALYTQAIVAGEELIPGLGIEIAKIDGFHVSIDDEIVTSFIDYKYKNTTKTLKNVTVLRSLD